MSDKLEVFDWQDSKKIFAFGVETVNIAVEYQAERKRFSEALTILKTSLAKAYQNAEIDRKIAESKAFMILAHRYENCGQALIDITESEQLFKGLEKVIETRQALISVVQSLIKNRVEQV